MRRLRKLQTVEGAYAMVALDQRESLRAMFPPRSGNAPASDDDLTAFKAAGVQALSPVASGLLIDRVYGLTGPLWPKVDDSCGLIVAADTLHGSDSVSHTSVDDAVTVDLLSESGAAGVKFLVLWHQTFGRSDRSRMIDQILGLANRAGVASVIEAIVRPDDGEWKAPTQKHDAILAAAEEICALEPDLYKSEVPGYVAGDVSGVSAAARDLNSIVKGDWVVLSNGVRQTEFASALAEAVSGGARGFLAGRAIWADLVGKADQKAAFMETALPRLRNLRQIVIDEADRRE